MSKPMTKIIPTLLNTEKPVNIVNDVIAIAEIGDSELDEFVLYNQFDMKKEIRETVIKSAKLCKQAYDKMAKLKDLPVKKRPETYDEAMIKLGDLKTKIHYKMTNRPDIFKKEDFPLFLEINKSFRNCFRISSDYDDGDSKDLAVVATKAKEDSEFDELTLCSVLDTKKKINRDGVIKSAIKYKKAYELMSHLKDLPEQERPKTYNETMKKLEVLKTGIHSVMSARTDIFNKEDILFFLGIEINESDSKDTTTTATTTNDDIIYDDAYYTPRVSEFTYSMDKEELPDCIPCEGDEDTPLMRERMSK